MSINSTFFLCLLGNLQKITWGRKAKITNGFSLLNWNTDSTMFARAADRKRVWIGTVFENMEERE